MIDNPSSYPDPSNIVKQEEPFVDVHLYTPNDYVGALMDLCQQKRGVLIDMKYLDDVRVDLHYALPLGEIVYDFFDAIKSRSRGYASYDYEFKDTARVRSGQAGLPAERRPCGCALHDRVPGQRLRQGPPHLRKAAG